MIPFPSSPTFYTATGAGEQPTELDLTGISKIDTYKRLGLDKPETDSSAAKTLGAYFIQSSDDESEDNNIGILTLGTDDRSVVDMNQNVQAVGLVGCLFLVHVPDKGKTYNAWHISGIDLCLLLNEEIRSIALSSRHAGKLEVQSCDARADDWKESVQENSGTTYLCGPNADEQARKFFNIDTINVTRTEKGPVSVIFDITTRSFHTNKEVAKTTANEDIQPLHITADMDVNTGLVKRSIHQFFCSFCQYVIFAGLRIRNRFARHS